MSQSRLLLTTDVYVAMPALRKELRPAGARTVLYSIEQLPLEKYQQLQKLLLTAEVIFLDAEQQAYLITWEKKQVKVDNVTVFWNSLNEVPRKVVPGKLVNFASSTLYAQLAVVKVEGETDGKDYLQRMMAGNYVSSKTNRLRLNPKLTDYDAPLLFNVREEKAAQHVDLRKLTKPQLVEVAANRGIKIPSDYVKPRIIAVLEGRLKLTDEVPRGVGTEYYDVFINTPREELKRQRLLYATGYVSKHISAIRYAFILIEWLADKLASDVRRRGINNVLIDLNLNGNYEDCDVKLPEGPGAQIVRIFNDGNFDITSDHFKDIPEWNPDGSGTLPKVLCYLFNTIMRKAVKHKNTRRSYDHLFDYDVYRAVIEDPDLLQIFGHYIYRDYYTQLFNTLKEVSDIPVDLLRMIVDYA